MIEVTADAPWQDAFRAGDHGAKGTWTAEDLDAAIADFSPAIEEAPINVDHETGGPAKGWIGALRRVGDLLQWKPRKIDPQLKQDVDDEKFIRQSIELYRRHPKTGRPYVRGIALLGNTTPAVRGLRPVKFSDNTEGFSDEAGNEIVRLECDFSPGGTMEKKNPPADAGKDPNVVAFAEFQAAKQERDALQTKFEAANTRVVELEAQMQSKDGRLDELEGQVKGLQSFAADLQQKANKSQADALLKELTACNPPKLTPAEADLYRPILYRASRDEVVPFGDKGQKRSEYQELEAALRARVPVASFGGVTPDSDPRNPNGTKADQIDEKVKEAVAEKVKAGEFKSSTGPDVAIFASRLKAKLMQEQGVN